MARGGGISGDTILYGTSGPRQAARSNESWKEFYPKLTPETTGIADNWFEGHAGWSGTGSWVAHVGSLPPDWVTISEAAAEMDPAETLAESLSSSWADGTWDDKLQPCRLEVWDADPANPKIAFVSEHEDAFTIPVKAGFMAAIEELTDKSLEHPEEAHWMVEEHGLFMAYVDADQQVFGLIYLNGSDGILARV